MGEVKNELDDKIAERLHKLYPEFGLKRIRRVEKRLKRAWLPKKVEGRWNWLNVYVATIQQRIAVREPTFRPISVRWVEEDTYIEETEIDAKLYDSAGSLSLSEATGGELSEVESEEVD